MRTAFFVGCLALLTSSVVVPIKSANAQQPKDWDKEKPVEVCIHSFERAQLAQKTGRLVKAMDEYKACARTVCPALVRTDCAQRLDAIERAIPTVSLVVRDASGSDLAVDIDVDGRPFAASQGRAAAIDPGEHEATWLIQDKTAYAQFTAHEGEKSRLIVLTPTRFVVQEARRPSEPHREAPPTLHQVTTSSPPTTAHESSSGPLILGGVGLALAVGGGAFIVAASGEKEGGNGAGYAYAAVTCLMLGSLAGLTALIWRLEDGNPRRPAVSSRIAPFSPMFDRQRFAVSF